MPLFWEKTPPFIEVKIDRDSVHPGDDTISHAATLHISSSATITEFLQQVCKPDFYPRAIAGNMTFLPSISGGKATWLIDCGGIKGKCIGVIAQQWQESKLTIPADTPFKAIISSISSTYFNFRYWSQVDPDIVYLCLLNGKSLPEKHG